MKGFTSGRPHRLKIETEVNYLKMKCSFMCLKMILEDQFCVTERSQWYPSEIKSDFEKQL